MPGTITLFATGYEPRGYARCNGQLLPIDKNQALYQMLGTRYGGDGTTTFGVPNLQPIAGGEKPVQAKAPTVRYITSTTGQISLFAGTFVPRGYTQSTIPDIELTSTNKPPASSDTEVAWFIQL